MAVIKMSQDPGRNGSESSGWVLPVVIGAVICSIMVAFVTVSVSFIEFHWAAWTRYRSDFSVPALVQIYRETYWAGCLLPIVTALAGYHVANRKTDKPKAIAWWASIIAIANLGWFLFWLLVLYLANQAFVLR